MGALDWGRLLSVDAIAVQDNEDVADELYTIIAKGDVSSSDSELKNVDNIVKLFSVMKAVISVKNLQYETCLEELEHLTQEGFAGQEQEYQDEINKLQEELVQHQKFSGTGDNYWRAELNKLEDQNKMLTKDLGELERRLRTEQASYDNVNRQKEELEANYKTTKRELEHAKSDINEYKLQFQSQRDSIPGRRGEELEIRDQINKKNQQLSQYLDEIKQLQDTNDDLQLQVDRNKLELQDATQEMNKLADDYTKLKTNLEDTDTIVEDMRKERDILRAQIQDMQLQLTTKVQADDDVMVALNQKVDEWKGILASKDAVILERDSHITRLTRQVQSSRFDSDQQKVMDLIESNLKKDERIEELQAKIELATEDYKDMTSQITTIKSKTKTGLPSVQQQKKIAQLNETLVEHRLSTVKEREHVLHIEQDIAEKDHEISELRARLLQYEKGTYGLSEAVQEIKSIRAQNRTRDKTIEDLTRQLNELHSDSENMTLENEEMRERLGIGSREEIDVDGIRCKRAIKEEQTQALNRVLQKEIENLEEERIQLKEMLRKHALERGEKAVKLGLSHVDLEPVGHHATSRASLHTDASIRSTEKLVPKEASSTDQTDQLSEKDAVSTSNAENVLEQKRKLEQEVKALKEENHQLEIGLREMHSMVKDPSITSLLKVPALEKLIAIIDERHATGQYDTTVQLKEQVQELTGRNDELRRELSLSREEAKSAVTQLDKKELAIVELQHELDSQRAANQGVVKVNPLPLPKGVLPTSKDVISCLNEYLMQVLQELSNKESLCSELESALENFRRKLSVITHQQSLLYKEHISARHEQAKERETFQKSKSEYETRHDQDEVRHQEFKRLLDNLSADPSRNKQLAAELTRKITVLRVNEKSLARRYTVLQDVESSLRKENSKLKNEMMDMEASVMQKVGELERSKELATFKIASLQRAIEDMVPATELELANRQFNEITAKYRDLLQRENMLVAKTTAVETVEAELKASQHSLNTLKEQFQLEKEKSYSLEQALEALIQKVGGPDGLMPVAEDEINSISRKMATLEMKELNERERANHAVRRYDQLKSLVNELENRNIELEQRFNEVSNLNLEGQRVERELRHELANSVPAAVHRSERERLTTLEESEARWRIESQSLKEMADVATHQTETVSMRYTSAKKELASMRRQLNSAQMETDEKTVIAKLHQQIVALQVSEAAAVRKLKVANSKVLSTESSIVKLKRQLEEKEESLFRVRSETRSKVHFLKRTIQDLRRQFSGALPLPQQEKFSDALRSLHERRIELESALADARSKHRLAEDRELELNLRKDGLEELIKTLKDGVGARKVAEWNTRMGEIRLEDMKLKREMDKINEQVLYHEKVTRQHESTISILEEQLMKQMKEFEDRHLLWEQHEIGLERTIEKLERQQSELADAAKRFEEATGSVPDASLPVANQLELAISKIHQHIRTIIVTRKEAEKMKQSLEEALEKLRKSESLLVQKERMINELRLRLPISDRETISSESQPKSSDPDDSRDYRQALKVAQTSVESLKLMLQKKEEILSKHQQLLNAAREEMKTQTESHQAEMKVLQNRLQLEIEEHIRKIKQVHQEYINAPQPAVATNKQLVRLRELEEMVVEQDSALAAGSEKQKKTRDQISTVKTEAEKNIKAFKQQKIEADELHASQIQKLQQELDQSQQSSSQKNREIEVLRQELESAKEANERAPSKTMKSLVERLRNQLAIKEKQQKTLSQALLQLRSDMVTNAEENVQAHAQKAVGELNVQKLIEKETTELSARIDDLQSRVERLKKELKKKKDDEATQQAELDSLKKDNARKERALKEMAIELKEREGLEDEIENMKIELRSLKSEATRNKSEVDTQRAEAEKFKVKVDELQKQKIMEGKPTQEQVVEARVAVVEQTSHESKGIDFTELDDKPVKETKSREEVVRWEEQKKWQKKVEFLRSKLKEKSEDHDRLEKMNGTLREALSRQEREKLSLQNRMKSLAKGGGDVAKLNTLPINHEDIVQGLKQRVFALEDENNELQRRLTLDKDSEIRELRIQVAQQQDSLQTLESEMAAQQSALHPEAAGWAFSREQRLQKEMMQIRKENMQLQFENEQAQRDIPRLKGRVTDLQEYTEILKSEIEGLKKKDKAKKASLGTGMGGQSVEDLERVIAATRRVVERLQIENESLRKKKMSKPNTEITQENEKLKLEMQKLKLAESSDLMKGTTVAKSNAKVIQENEHLRKDLKKEKEDAEKFRITSRNLEIVNEKLHKDIEELQQQIDIQSLNTEEPGALQKKSVVVSKALEEKLRIQEQELGKKNSILQDIKSHLRGAAEREAELLRCVDDYQEKITLLENFPLGVHTENDAAKALQQSRLQVARLEAEKEELTFELERLRKLTNNGEKAVNVTQDEILEKLRKYDKMLACEVELRTRIKTIEIERDKYSAENRKLKKELSAFDPAFFEELEDLKFNYKKSVERNVLYEKQLRQLSRQFGVEVNIPNDDDYT